MTHVCFPANERVAVEILIAVLSHREPIDPAGAIVDGAVDGRELDERLHDHERRPIGDARHFLGAEDVRGRGHARVGTGANRHVQVADAHTGFEPARFETGRDLAEAVALGVVRSLAGLAVGTEAEEVLLWKVTATAVELDERPARSDVFVVADGPGKTQQRFADEILLRRYRG